MVAGIAPPLHASQEEGQTVPHPVRSPSANRNNEMDNEPKEKARAHVCLAQPVRPEKAAAEPLVESLGWGTRAGSTHAFTH
jgi:hypothetical protein